MRRRPLLTLPLCSALLSMPLAGQQRPPSPEPVSMPVSFSDVQTLPRRAPDRVLRYGDAPSQRIAVWHADGGQGTPAPVIVLLHGGCWLSQYGVDHVEPLATSLSAAGFAVWAPEYRRLGEAGGGWPGTFEDIAEAVDRLAAERAGALDPARAVLVGHSAGGHLALWAAARSAFPTSHPQRREGALVPRAAVALAPITDLASYAAEPGSCAESVPQLMGGTPAALAERYRQSSPAALPRPVPVSIVHGSADPIVPLRQARAVAGATLRLVEGAGHFDLVHPGTPAFGVLLEELERILD